MADQHAFRVVQMVPVITYREQVLLKTDDWLEAEEKVSERMRLTPDSMRQDLPRIVGTHPSHDWQGRRCTRCGAFDNGSYSSHAPCGFDFKGRPLLDLIDDWRAERGADRG